MSDPQVFISYSQDDSEWVNRFATALKARRVNVWLDTWQVKPGEPLLDALEAGLRASDTIVSVLTQANAQRPNMLFELGVALGGGKRLIPIVSPELDGARLPLGLGARRYLTRGAPEEAAREVADALTGTVS